MKDNCYRCAKGVLMLDGSVWCSELKADFTCEYEKGHPTIYKPDNINAIKKKAKRK